jgi:hypothetical protein
MSRIAALAAAAALLTLPSACGDALSSLDAVQAGQREQYAMQLAPDFARRGQTVAFELQLDETLMTRLGGQAALPAEIQFGEGTALRSFDATEGNPLKAEVLISPLAVEGEREANLTFCLSDGLIEARGSFWVLPSLPGHS